MLERAFTIAAGLFLLAAAVFLWWNNMTAVFVFTALAVVAWFLSFRAQTRARQALESPIESDEDVEE